MALPPLSSFATNPANNAPTSPGVLPSLSSFSNQSLASQNLGMNLAASHPFNPLNPNFQQNESNVMQGVHQGVMGNLPSAIGEGITNIGKGIGQGYMDMTKNLGQDFQNLNTHAAQTASAAGGSLTSFQNPGRQLGGLGKMGGDILSMGSDAIQGIFSPISAILTPIIQGDANGLANNPTFQQIANSKGATDVANAAQQATSAYQDWAAKNPDQAKAVASTANILAATLGEGPANEAASTATDVAQQGLNKGVNAVNDAANSVASTVGDATTAVKNTVGNIKESISPTLTPEEQVGKIIQGKTTDIPAAQRTFASMPDVNPAKMDTANLSEAVQSKIQDNLDKVDTAFANDTTPHQMSEFNQTVGKGENAVTTNYVQQAIDQLKAHYTATNDATGLSDMKALETKAKTEGLSSQELNNLAKEHGTEMPKAFSKTGEPLSGLNKQATENTRAGLKTTARKMLAESDPEAAKTVTQLDKGTSDAIRTKTLLDKQIEKEATDIQKNGKPGAFQKWIKANPVKAKILGYTIGGTVIDKTIKAITGVGF